MMAVVLIASGFAGAEGLRLGLGLDLGFDLTMTSMMVPGATTGLRLLVDPVRFLRIEPRVGIATMQSEEEAGPGTVDVVNAVAATTGVGVYVAIPLEKGSVYFGPEYQYDRVSEETITDEGTVNERTHKEWLNGHLAGAAVGIQRPLADFVELALHVVLGGKWTRSQNDYWTGGIVERQGFVVKPTVAVKFYFL
jgi:hypothetical protein